MFSQPLACRNIYPAEILGCNNPASGLFNVSGQAYADPSYSSSTAMVGFAHEIPDFLGQLRKEPGGIRESLQALSALDLSIYVGQSQEGLLSPDLYPHAVQLLGVEIKVGGFAADSSGSVLRFVDPTVFQ